MRHPPSIHLISGGRGAGKTTLCRRIAASARRAGLDVGGLISLPRLQEGEKTGIEAEDLRTGDRRLLASRQPDELAGVKLGSWTFDEQALKWGSRVLQAAVPCDILIIDELGPLEFERGLGWLEGFEALESRSYRLAAVVIRPEYAESFMERWPEMVKNTLSNYDEADALANWFEMLFQRL